jgi:hypothetical protein
MSSTVGGERVHRASFSREGDVRTYVWRFRRGGVAQLQIQNGSVVRLECFPNAWAAMRRQMMIEQGLGRGGWTLDDFSARAPDDTE